jgi:hypothetical protein
VADGKNIDVFVYEVTLMFSNGLSRDLVCSSLDLYEKQGIHALIGCDLLQDLYFVLDETTNSIKLGF